MIKEAQTIHLFRQEHDTDIQDCVKYFGLEASNAQTLGTLPQGEHLLKVGSHKEIRVNHVRTEREKQFTETDAAMLLPATTEGTLSNVSC
jgi:2-succinyl-5-enolpyruvyl-6-hydroxy-3-cyclohexene-1-carboxylate synthase